MNGYILVTLLVLAAVALLYGVLWLIERVAEWYYTWKEAQEAER